MILRATARRPSASIEDRESRIALNAIARSSILNPRPSFLDPRPGPLESGRGLVKLRLGFGLKKSVELHFDRAITFAGPHLQAAPVQDVNVTAHITDHSRLA